MDNDYFKQVLNAGVILGILYFFIFLLLYFFNVNPFGTFSWLGFPLLAGGMYYYIKLIRDKVEGGEMNFGKVFRTGTTMAFVFSSFIGILSYFFCLYVGTDILEMHKQEAIEGLSQAQQFFDESLIDKMIEEIQKISVGNLAYGDFQSKFIGYALLSFIYGFLLKKEKPLFDTQA